MAWISVECALTSKLSTNPFGMNEERIEALRSVLCSIQKMRKVKNGLTIFLVSDDSDWLVIMQCLQNHGLFRQSSRPPLKNFVDWMASTQIPQYLTICNQYYMSMASRELKGARYPWRDVTWNPHMLVRWRALYHILDRKLTEQGL